MAGMLSVFADFEREIIRERVKAGIRRQKPKGDSSGVRESCGEKGKGSEATICEGLE
jgi:DNA invertase Pin-like site-specific DNA recombinase